MITVLTHDPRWKGKIRLVRMVALATLAHQSILDVDATIVLSNDTEIQTLNQQHRGFDKPTNILSFEDGATFEGRRQLGDIIIAFDTVARESREQAKSVDAHLAHLVAHGLLHLLGHDHEAEDEAERMESVEISILATLGIANPYD